MFRDFNKNHECIRNIETMNTSGLHRNKIVKILKWSMGHIYEKSDY